MPVAPTYPGVYIQEIPSGVRTISGVATSITAFIGQAVRGPVNNPTTVNSFGDFERIFGGLSAESTMSYAVRHFFQNGGGQALIVRVVAASAEPAALTLPTGDGNLVLGAISAGAWGNNLQALVDYDTADPDNTALFNLTISYVLDGKAVSTERFLNLTVEPGAARNVEDVLEAESNLVFVETLSEERPEESVGANADPVPGLGGMDDNGADFIDEGDYAGEENNKTGLYALERADIFNILCIPPVSFDTDISTDLWGEALTYCKRRRAVLIVDSPTAWNDVSDITANSNQALSDLTGSWSGRDYAALYFPHVLAADPLKENRMREFVPCGMVAGVYARTDATRGVWKAPAGQEASLSGARQLSVKMTDAENGQLNPLGVNCLRSLPAMGNVVWGSRTVDGADRLASEWKYVPVRRLALYIEESLFRGTQWVVFEPNDEPLWAQIRLNVGAFMHNLFRQGAFQGATPRDAYFVKCDRETTTQNDINNGVVNVLVGFAPLKPAEFVIISIQQMAGQIDT